MAQITDPAQAWSAVASAWDAHVDDADEHTTAATVALLDQLDVQPGDSVLELASGPGSLATTWSELVGSKGRVVLSDIAPGMVAVARVRTTGQPNIDTALIDASAIDAPDESFDVVACRMGLMFTLEPATALAEIHRVLRPGGRVGTLTWGAIERNPWMTCVGMAAMMNGLVSGGPPVGPGGMFSLGDPTELERLAKEAGFADVHVEAIDVAFRASSVESHIERVTALAGPLAGVLEAASTEQRAAFHKTAVELASPYVTADGVELPGQAVLLAARRSR